ncbi:hypothetical protein PENTCL1PPCAC_9634, partial [Pristionchus entomophagus]
AGSTPARSPPTPAAPAGRRFPSSATSQFANGVTIPGGVKRHISLCTDAALANWTSPKSSDPILSLEEVYAQTLVTQPFVIPVDWHVSSSRPPKPRGSAADYVDRFRTLLRFFKPQDLPGVDMWTFDSYEANDEYTATKRDGVEMFRDREVERVVAYCAHQTDPFVLVKLVPENNKESRVRDIIRAVHCHLAVFLFPKKFVEYTGRMIRLSTDYQAADDPYDRSAAPHFV